MSSADIVHAQFDAYNAQDEDAFAAFHAEDAVIAGLHGAVVQRSRADIRARFACTLADHPRDRAWAQSRIATGSTVVDHEVGERSPGGARFELVAIYTIRDGVVARLDVAR